MTESFEEKVKKIALGRMKKNKNLTFKNKIGAIHIVGMGKQSNFIEVSFYDVWWHPFIILELLFNIIFSPIICLITRKNIFDFIKIKLFLYMISCGYKKEDLTPDISEEIKVK